MPFVKRRDIALAAKSEADKQYKKQLHAALRTYGLSDEARRDIQFRLDQVGKPRVYNADSPPPPGAITLTSPEPHQGYPRSELEGMKKAELVVLAAKLGFPTSGTKATLVECLAAR